MDWDITKQIKGHLTIHSSVTKELMTKKKVQEMDLFRRRAMHFVFNYSIYQEEEELAVLTFTLSLQ